MKLSTISNKLHKQEYSSHTKQYNQLMGFVSNALSNDIIYRQWYDLSHFWHQDV